MHYKGEIKMEANSGSLYKYKTNIFKVALNLFFIILSILMLLPFYWMLITAFKPDDQLLIKEFSQLFPKRLTIKSFIDAWINVDFLRLYINSLIIALVSTVSTIFISSLAGYSFAKYKFKLSKLFFILVLATMMIPFQVIMIPLYILIVKLGWQNTYQAIFFPQLASGFGVFLMRQFIETIPNDLLDAARIEGCSEFKIYWKIVMPLIKPVTATLGLFTFMWSWDNFLWPLVVIESEEMRTIPLGIAMVTQMAGARVQQNQLMAISIIGMVPVLIVFLLLQKYFVKGIVMSGFK